jgi:hypothetical protein
VKRIFGPLLLFVALSALPIPALAAGGPATISAVTTGDFDGDGTGDLAVGAPGEDVGEEGSEIPNAGAVNVIYGESSGLSSQDDQIWHQDSASGDDEVEDEAEENDAFGTSVAAGDFNRDGFDDLAIGVPLEDLPTIDAGIVQILYGSEQGLTAHETQSWTAGSASLPTSSDDTFGKDLVTGDFGRSRADDLAIGAPHAEGGATFGGLVLVLSGKSGPTDEGGGLALAGHKVLHQDVDGVAGVAETGDWFGHSLAAGDFGGTREDDLAIGTPFEEIENEFGAGAVLTFYGSDAGIVPSDNQMWHQDVPDIKGDLGPDLFGWDLAAADFGKGTRDDLAASSPQDTVGGEFAVGTASVIYGSASGLRAAGNQLWHLGLASVEGDATASSFVGGAIAAGDVGRSSHGDLAFGDPRANVNGNGSAGEVHVLYGSRRGVTGAGDQVWSQNSNGIADSAQINDQLGAGMAVGDLGKTGEAELVISVPNERVDGENGAGAVNVIYGAADGLRAAGDQIWHQNSPDVEDEAESFDDFGGIA